MGKKKTLRYVAHYGDACDLPDIPDGGATLRRKLAVLSAEAGREFTDIEKTVSSRFDPAALPSRCDELAELGIEHLVLITTGPWTRAAVDSLARSMRR